MDRLTDEARQDSSWIIMFIDDTVISGENREQVEESSKRVSYALERKRSENQP